MGDATLSDYFCHTCGKPVDPEEQTVFDEQGDPVEVICPDCGGSLAI